MEHALRTDARIRSLFVLLSCPPSCLCFCLPFLSPSSSAAVACAVQPKRSKGLCEPSKGKHTTHTTDTHDGTNTHKAHRKDTEQHVHGCEAREQPHRCLQAGHSTGCVRQTATDRRPLCWLALPVCPASHVAASPGHCGRGVPATDIVARRCRREEERRQGQQEESCCRRRCSCCHCQRCRDGERSFHVDHRSN